MKKRRGWLVFHHEMQTMTFGHNCQSFKSYHTFHSKRELHQVFAVLQNRLQSADNVSPSCKNNLSVVL